MRAGTDCIESFFVFETATGRGEGVLRLKPAAGGQVRAWTLLTALDQLKGHEERAGRNRPRGASYSRDFSGPNWADKRRAATLLGISYRTLLRRIRRHDLGGYPEYRG